MIDPAMHDHCTVHFTPTSNTAVVEGERVTDRFGRLRLSRTDEYAFDGWLERMPSVFLLTAPVGSYRATAQRLVSSAVRAAGGRAILFDGSLCTTQTEVRRWLRCAEASINAVGEADRQVARETIAAIVLVAEVAAVAKLLAHVESRVRASTGYYEFGAVGLGPSP